MGLARYEKMKEQVIEQHLTESAAYDICTIQDRIGQITKELPDWELQMEIDDLRSSLHNSAAYKVVKSLEDDIKFKENELKARQELRKVSESLVIDHMLNNDITELRNGNKVIKLRNKPSFETILDSIDEVPDDFRRVKVELDKVKAREFYKNTGVLIPGVSFQHKENWTIQIEEVKK